MISFEGPEKKLEINLRPGLPSLRSWDQSEWAKVVEKSHATILSKISSDACDAYLLSESSLMVWDDCCVMITCGTTTLVDAAEHLVAKIGAENIEAFFYERKNEYFPAQQRSCFRSDVGRLKDLISGTAYQFGRPDEHHVYLFHDNQAYEHKRLDTTLEILMYDIGGRARQIFGTSGLSTEKIRQETGVDRILPGYSIDDYAFTPVGYSLNALKGSRYYTVHVTPQKNSPYVSFETNEATEVRDVIGSVLETFQPRSFDVVFFDPNAKEEIIDLKGYEKRSSVRTELSPGFGVQYGHFSKKGYVTENPIRLKL